MRTTSRDLPRRPVSRSACTIALALALASGTTGCAHRQLTNTEFVVGAVAVTAIVGGAVLIMRACDGPTEPCRRPPDRSVELPTDAPPPLTGLRAIPGR